MQCETTWVAAPLSNGQLHHSPCFNVYEGWKGKSAGGLPLCSLVELDQGVREGLPNITLYYLLTCAATHLVMLI